MHLTAAKAAFTIAIIALTAILAAASSATSSAAAQQESPPHAFVGRALIDGRPAPEGTVISAIVEGVRVNSAIVDSSGNFADIQVFSAGKDVSFNIGEFIARINISSRGINQAQAVTAEVGGLDFLELTASETSFNPQAVTNRQVLFDLYYATQGVNWRNSTNWLSREPLGTWHGVSTGQGGVIGLRLSDNRLRGSIPSVLGNLTGLTRLELRGGNSSNSNQLTGNIPPELGNLPDLAHLDLSNNMLGGQIPAGLGNLANLTHLDLSNNGLSGSIPPELGNLTNLVFLDLSGNKLSGRIPTSLGNLKNSIETLRIANTGLEGCIPDDLKYVQSSSTDIPQLNLALPFCSEYRPPPTSEVTPGSTGTPGPGGSVQATPTPKPTTPIGQPTVNFHASQTEVLTGEPVVLTLSVANSIAKPEMTLQLVLQLPSGLLVSGEGGIGEECSVQCVGIYKVGTGENKDFLLSAVANQPGSFDIDGRMEWYFGNELDETHDGDVETLRIEVVAPQLPPTPTPTPTPTPEPTVPPHVGQPTVNLHATQTEAQLGDPVRLQLSVVNSIAKPEMTLKLIMQVPSGWSMNGSGFTDSCTGQCTATYMVDSGDQRSIEIEMQPNQAGSFTVEAQMEWWFEDDVATLDGKAVSLPMTVVGPATPTPAPPTVAPAPFVPPSSGGGGCNSFSDSAGPGSLVLLGLLILPVVGLVARPLLSRGPVSRAAVTPFDWVARMVLVGPAQAVNAAGKTSLSRKILVLLVVEAVALSLIALLFHIMWGDAPGRSSFTVLIWPLGTLLVLGTVSLLGRPNVPTVFLGVPLAFWVGLLLLYHLSQFALDDPSLLYGPGSWGTLTPMLIVAGVAWLFDLREKLGGQRTA